MGGRKRNTARVRGIARARLERRVLRERARELLEVRAVERVDKRRVRRARAAPSSSAAAAAARARARAPRRPAARARPRPRRSAAKRARVDGRIETAAQRYLII